MLLPKWADTRAKEFLEAHGYVPVRGGNDKAARARRKRMLDVHAIDLVIDVGANVGQYGLAMRELGYTGRIHSFEPMSAAWNDLQRAISADPLWSATQVGLADSPGRMTLHIAGNSISSSVLPMLARHEANAPKSSYIRDETVEMSTLDLQLQNIRHRASNIWLKLDVQGFESKVVDGALHSLADVSFIQTEMSLVRLYSGGVTYLPLCLQLDRLGFDLVGVEPGFQDTNDGTPLQIDGIFRRRVPNSAQPETTADR